MLDADAQRRALDMVLATPQSTANASAAVEARELLREDIAALLVSDPERAWCISESVLLQNEKYRNDSRFPNIRDLLSTFSRLG